MKSNRYLVFNVKVSPRIVERAVFDPMLVVIENRVLVCQVRQGFMDCSGAKSAGELHNAGLAVLLGSRGQGKGPGAGVPVEILVGRLKDWLPNSGIMKTPVTPDGMAQLSRSIVEKFQAAGVVSGDKRVSPRAFENPSSVIAYLGRRGSVSLEFAATLGRLAQNNATPQQFQEAFSSERWKGKDKMAAAVFLDIKTASRRYWENGAGGSSARITRSDLWDALGGLLTLEVAGGIPGALLMSAVYFGPD